MECSTSGDLGLVCKACNGDMPSIPKEEVESILAKEAPEWTVTEDGRRVFRKYLFSDFMAGMKFLNSLAEICEKQSHHPVIHYSHYRHLILEFYTYATNSVTENDIIMVKLADQLLSSGEFQLSKFYKTKEQRKNSEKPVNCNYDDIYYPPRGPHTFDDQHYKTH
jgi:4a-hydroxytetrahydrobiopterin dehydratase